MSMKTKSLPSTRRKWRRTNGGRRSRNQVIFIIFCVALLLLYTANRYSSLQDIIKIDSLQTRFEKVHYEVLTQSSELLNKERQSNVEKRLLEIGDTMMLNNNTPPFALPQKEE